jgi:predicted ester cyclase
MDPTDLYRRYLRRCNEYRFEELGEFVAAEVEVNDAPSDLAMYRLEEGRIAAAWGDLVPERLPPP